MDPQRFLAKRLAGISASGIRRIFDLAATLDNPIDFSIGQPDFAVPEPIKNSAIDAIRADRNGYTVTHGIPALREAIAADLSREFTDWSPSVFVSSGVSGALTLLMMVCLDPDDEIIFADPYFVSYPHLTHLVGAKAVPVSTYPEFKLDAAAIEKAITPRTKLLLLNSPGNPTGVVYPADQIQAVCEVARKHDLLIASDEIYNMLSFDGPVPSPVTYAPERTILLRGFGKTYGLTGWRLGYVAGPAEVVTEMAKLQQYTFVCAPQPLQHACITALETDMTDNVAAYRAKRNRVAEILRQAFDFPHPAGGFYFFPRVPEQFENGTAFVEAAIKRNVLTVPGIVFSRQDTNFRISYAVADDKLARGCEILCDLAKGK